MCYWLTIRVASTELCLCAQNTWVGKGEGMVVPLGRFSPDPLASCLQPQGILRSPSYLVHAVPTNGTV
jgi:hypothetical protein